MHVDLWTLGLQTINVLVLVWILSRFLFRPITAMLAERQVAAARALEEAQAVRAAAAAEGARAKDEAANLAAARADILKKTIAAAETEKTSLLAAARGEVEAMREAGRADIERERQSALVAEEEHATRLAIDIAMRLFERLPVEARAASFIDGLADGVAALPEVTRQELGLDGAPLQVKAACALTTDEVEKCRARLAEILGRPVDICVSIDVGLIAGLEIDAPHAIVRNSFKADLDRIAAGLTQHDR